MGLLFVAFGRWLDTGRKVVIIGQLMTNNYVEEKIGNI